MIDISYTLHAEDGELLSEEIQSPLVPRIGELVTISQTRSFQVVDVLWHHYQKDGSTGATVTACEVNWHKHIGDVVDQWRRDRYSSQ